MTLSNEGQPKHSSNNKSLRLVLTFHLANMFCKIEGYTSCYVGWVKFVPHDLMHISCRHSRPQLFFHIYFTQVIIKDLKSWSIIDFLLYKCSYGRSSSSKPYHGKCKKKCNPLTFYALQTAPPAFLCQTCNYRFVLFWKLPSWKGDCNIFQHLQR